jgi:hypothetical protein
MAAFRQRQGRWQATIRRKGRDPLNKTFTKQAAEKWARSIESDMDKGRYVNLSIKEKAYLFSVISNIKPDKVLTNSFQLWWSKKGASWRLLGF